MILDNLTPEEINLIIETLLYSSTPDIIAGWTDEYCDKMINLAVKIKRNVYLERDTILNGDLSISKENECHCCTKAVLIKQYFDLNIF